MIYMVDMRSGSRDPDLLTLAVLSELGALKRVLPGVWLLSTKANFETVALQIHNRAGNETFFFLTELPEPAKWTAFAPDGGQLREWLDAQPKDAPVNPLSEGALRLLAARRLAAQYAEKKGPKPGNG